jgi:hypothetical protein
MLFLLSKGQEIIGVVECGKNLDEFYRRVRVLIAKHFHIHSDHVTMHLNSMGYYMNAIQEEFDIDCGNDIETTTFKLS